MDLARECRNDSNHTRRRGAKSFVDDLDLSRGVVLSRAVVLLRSIETKPYDSKICPLRKDTSFVILVRDPSDRCYRAVVTWVFFSYVYDLIFYFFLILGPSDPRC